IGEGLRSQKKRHGTRTVVASEAARVKGCSPTRYCCYSDESQRVQEVCAKRIPEGWRGEVLYLI
ncbi:MAG: hypothetical protein AAFW70_27135, partial [Cyanobacteria bacterium J06635_10]